MANLDNNVNINNANRAYTPNLKKGEDAKPQVKTEEVAAEAINDGTQAADSYGRILVKQAGKADAQQVAFKAAMEFYAKNPELAAASINAGDHAYDLLEAQGVSDAYAKACTGSCDAAYSRAE